MRHNTQPYPTAEATGDEAPPDHQLIHHHGFLGQKKHPNFKRPNFFAYNVALGLSFAVALCGVLGWLPRM